MSNDRSNNGRVMPEAVTDNRVEVVAAPVDKLKTYRPDLGETAKTKATYQGLASLGQGVMTVSGTLWQSSGDEVFAAYEKTADKNREDWKEVSKNIKGMAKYNPYNKDAYNQIHATQVYRQMYDEVLATPNLEKKSSDEIDALFEGQHQKALQMLEERGVDVKNYAGLQIEFDNRLAQIKHEYADKNAKYNYELFKNKSSSNMAYALYEAVGSDKPKGEALADVLTEQTTFLKEVTGTPADDQAEIIMNALGNALAIDPSKFTGADLLALKGFKIDGKTLEEIVPNYGARVQKMVREAKEACLSEKEIDYKTRKFNQELLRDAASNEALKFLVNNPKADMKTQQKFFMELAKKYELDGDTSFKFFNEVANGRKYIADLKSLPSDEETRLGLQLKLNEGSLTAGDINRALNSGKLNVSDATNLFDRLKTIEDKQQKQYAIRVDRHFQRVQDEYIGDPKTHRTKMGTPAICRNSESVKELTEALTELRSRYEQESITNPEQAYKNFNNDLATLKVVGKVLDQRVKNSEGIKLIKNKQEVVKKISGGQAVGFEKNVSQTKTLSMTQAFKELGLFRTADGKGKDYNVGVGSAPSLSRLDPVTKEIFTRHVGYDLTGSYGGRPVYLNKGGTVVYVSRASKSNNRNGGAGNTLIIQTPDGKFVRFMHLQHAGLPSIGSTVTGDVPVGYVGNTGKTTGNCLHVEFYNSDGNWIPVERF